MKINQSTLGILIAIFSAIAYGVYPPAARAVYAHGGDAVFVILTTTWARALLMAGFCFFTHKPLFASQTDTKTGAIGGIFQAISSIGILASLLYLPGPLMIAIIFTHTLMQLFFMAWRKEVKLDTATVISTIMALIGLTIVLDIWHPQQVHWLGVGLAFMAAVATMSRMYVYGKLTRTRNAAIVGAEAFIFTGIFLSFIVFFKTPVPPVSLEGYLWTGLACISIALGTFGMFYGIALIGAFQFSMVLKLEPIFNSLFSVLFIGEVLQWRQYVGVGVVVASLAAYQVIISRQKISD